MTATTPSKRGFKRIPSMESLGFMDAPSRSWTTPPRQSEPGNGSSQVSGLVSVPVGRHSLNGQPTGELVTDMWETTELHAPSLEDWAPQAFGSKHLGVRRFRWPMLLLVIIMTLSAAGIGYWLYRQPADEAAAALGEVRAEAEALTAALDQVAPLVDDIDLDRLPEANRDASVYLEMGDRARAMFAASAELPSDDSSGRAVAAEAAGMAIDASKQLMDVTTYRTALEPALTLPLLDTDPDLTDLATATDAFTQWRTGFESVRTALPADVAPQASAALDRLSANLEQTQASYLDAMGTDNRGAAVEALGALRAELQEVRHAMITDIGSVSEAVATLIDQAREDLGRLLG
jgi:hypothetical protein